MPWLKYKNKVDKNDWEEDEDATQFAHELLHNEEIQLDADVHMIKLNKAFQLEALETPSLFVRSHTRALWKTVYQYLSSKPVAHALVTGNPGIGKSRSLTYLLRLLLKDNKLVIFESQKDKRVLAFVPPSKHEQSSTYKVWVVPISLFIPACPALYGTENYYLIDPNQEATSPAIVAAHTVLAASPNRIHYQDFLKAPGSDKFLMPVWTEPELLAIRTIMHGQLSETQVREKYYKFGGIPSYVFADSGKLESAWEPAIDSAIHRLLFEQLVASLANGATIELNQEHTIRVSSMLFQYVFVEALEAGSQLYGKSKKNIRLEVASEYVSEKICEKYWGQVLDMMNPKSTFYSDSGANVSYLKCLQLTPYQRVEHLRFANY